MAKLKISKITSEIPLGVFDCGNPSINSLITDSFYPTILQHVSTFAFSAQEELLGYYMLKILNIKLNVCPESLSEYTSSICDECVSVHIKFLAVDSDFQNNGIGSNVLKYIIKSVYKLCYNWPIRLITLEALKEKYDWYCNLGFTPFNEADLSETTSPTILMYMDCLLNPELVNNYINNSYL